MLSLLAAALLGSAFIVADEKNGCPDWGTKPMPAEWRTTNVVNCGTGALVIRSGRFEVDNPATDKWCPLETIITPPYEDLDRKPGFRITGSVPVKATLIIRECATDRLFFIIPINKSCSFVKSNDFGFRNSWLADACR